METHCCWCVTPRHTRFHLTHTDRAASPKANYWVFDLFTALLIVCETLLQIKEDSPVHSDLLLPSQSSANHQRLWAFYLFDLLSFGVQYRCWKSHTLTPHDPPANLVMLDHTQTPSTSTDRNCSKTFQHSLIHGHSLIPTTTVTVTTGTSQNLS